MPRTTRTSLAASTCSAWAGIPLAERLCLLPGKAGFAVAPCAFRPLRFAGLGAFLRAFGLFGFGPDAGELQVVQLAAGAADDMEGAIARWLDRHGVAFGAGPVGADCDPARASGDR